MPVSQGTIDSLLDVLRPLGRLSVRRMFGAVAVYCDGQVFALIDDDIVYFKVDDTTRGAYETEGCGPFRYATKSGEEHVIGGYSRLPDRLLDDADEIAEWARTAIAVGRRTAARKARSTPSHAHASAKPLRRSKAADR